MFVFNFRAFSAYEEGCEVDVDCEHSERLLLDVFTEKFLSCNLPDPFSLKIGWCGEEEGMKSWPSLFFMDIEKYFLKRVNAKSYDVWAIVEKDANVQPGGTIIASYCTCVAGLLGSCSHVAGMLFRLEAAVLSGFTQLTCTQKLAEWNILSKKKKIEPGSLTNFHVNADHYKKKVLKRNLNQCKDIVKKRLEYVSFCKENKAYLKNKENTRKKFFNEIKDLIPQSCFAEVMVGKKLFSEINKNTVYVDSIKEAVEKFKKNPLFSSKENINLVVEKLVSCLHLTDEQIKYTYEKTILQSQSRNWIIHRKCRITSSNFKQIYTRTKSYLNNPNICTTSIPNIILGESESFQTFSIKYGIAQEVHAKIKYKHLIKKSHENATFANPGMTILKTHPFISASSDMEIFWFMPWCWIN
ncbi:uncharacterized protein LOC136073423 [Hydra vulgaris]|uniref:uncharacterized protein LOC136073423 n=1 Tax=Hydra vulgaris TaxID=6087 RepID=UPI0032EA1AF5